MRHLDEAADVCDQCARILGQNAKAVTELAAELSRCQQLVRTLSGEQEARWAAEQRLAELQQTLADMGRRGDDTEARLAACERQRQEAERELRLQKEGRGQQPLWWLIGIEMVPIPKGEFQFGGNNAKINLADYSLARTPVTNLQYRYFVDSVNYRRPEHWLRGQIPKGKERHPVVNVKWGDARDFCAWAGLRLPTEEEWEKGARGVDGHKYPWGEELPSLERCNFGRKMGGTTPVELYLNGRSPYGLFDMAGNVWEWTSSRDKRGWWYNRIARGGSWYDLEDDRMTTFSQQELSVRARHENVGFRPAM